MMNTVEQTVNIKKIKRPTRKTMLFIYFYLILLLLLLLTVSTYTWFALSKTPRVSNMSMYVTSRSGLELSLTSDGDDDDWGNRLSYVDMVSETSPLRPVTWSEKDQCFYAADYGIDGRLTSQWQPLSDERNANRDDNQGYYCIGTFFARTSEKVKVSLTPAVEIDEGISGSGTYLIGTPLWDAESIVHHNAGQGAENAVRVGIKITYLDNSGNLMNDSSLFYIYEPNCDSHLDGSVGYVETPSIDGTATLIPAERHITQTYSSWSETDPVQNGVQIYSFGEFLSPTDLFTLEANQKAMIQIYIWLEGQDVDCTNEIEEAQIIANLQFLATPDPGSGFQPIE